MLIEYAYDKVSGVVINMWNTTMNEGVWPPGYSIFDIEKTHKDWIIFWCYFD